MTPDGPPVVGWNRETGRLLHATGTRGQGYGNRWDSVPKTVHETTYADEVILSGGSPYRDFGGEEALK